jgi:CHAT domain-containing protein
LAADLSRAQTLEEGLHGDSRGRTSSVGASKPQEIARKLNATLLFYWMGPRHSYVWVVTPKNVSQIPLLNSQEIDATVADYRDSFIGPRDQVEAGNADGKKLYEALIRPAEKMIPRNSRVIVLPDGSLHSLNFETLIVSEPKPHYWIEDVTVTSANSLALLERTTLTAPPKDGSLLLIGDALLANPEFPPLPQAGKEVGLVENYFDQAKRTELLKGNATATRYFSSSPEKFNYLHFTTHGTASRTQPLESAVILSPEGDSYKLYARDILQHPLNAYLVTISACNGAGLKTYEGEGLEGLSWAFLRAGAHNVIGGLWEVSNASAPPLMDELYKGIHNGDDPATALRKAKLTLVHSTGNYRKPFYWAPFVLYAGS